MSDKKLVLPLSYTNIGNVGGLKDALAGAAVHAPVAPTTTSEWLDDLSSELPAAERKLVRYAAELNASEKHQGWSLEQDGRVLVWKGRFQIQIRAEVSAIPQLPKKRYVTLEEVRKVLRKLGDGYYEVMGLVRHLNSPAVMRFAILDATHIEIYDPFARTVHQIEITPIATKVSTHPGLFE